MGDLIEHEPPEPPAQYANAMERVDAQIVEASAASSRLRVRPEKSRTGWTLKLAPDVEACDLRAALHVVSAQLRGSRISDVLALLTKLMAGCRRPMHLSDDDVGLYSGTLAEVMVEYPIDIVDAAVMRWLRAEQWWPESAAIVKYMADELAGRRALRDEIAAQSEAMDRKPRDGRSIAPVGITLDFVDRVRRVAGDSYVRAWLGGGILALFSSDTVYVATSTQENELREKHWRAIKDSGVKIEKCRQVYRLLEDHCNSATFVSDAPKKKQKREFA